MKIWGGGGEGVTPSFLTSTLAGDELASRFGRFRKKSTQYPLYKEAGLDDVENRKFLTLLGLELQPLGRPSSHYTDCAISAHEFVPIHVPLSTVPVFLYIVTCCMDGRII
jgi:hypothetical protein